MPDPAAIARILGERAALGDELARAPRVVDCRLDLPAVPDDGRVLEERIDTSRREAGHLLVVEFGEGAPEGLALAENGEPAQPRLESLQGILEQPAVVGRRAPPFRVVIRA